MLVASKGGAGLNMCKTNGNVISEYYGRQKIPILSRCLCTCFYFCNGKRGGVVVDSWGRVLRAGSPSLPAALIAFLGIDLP